MIITITSVTVDTRGNIGIVVGRSRGMGRMEAGEWMKNGREGEERGEMRNKT
jgi:hypothetical protein